MTTHCEKNPEKLIAELRLLYGKTPITIWYDRNFRRYDAYEAFDLRKNSPLINNRRFDLVGTITIDTPIEVIKQEIERVKRLNSWDQKIPTSMQNLPVDYDDR